jgi:ribosomal protein L12E/L44/L45/RPP1/RPP2
MAAKTPTPEQIAHLLNNINIGTNKAKIGDLIAALLDRVATLEVAVKALQTP